jgi:hypothetical protein
MGGVCDSKIKAKTLPFKSSVEFRRDFYGY